MDRSNKLQRIVIPAFRNPFDNRKKLHEPASYLLQETVSFSGHRYIIVIYNAQGIKFDFMLVQQLYSPHNPFECWCT